MGRLISFIQGILRKCGIEVRKAHKYGDSNYENIFPNASYAPWNKDELFLDTYSKITDFTLVDKYRCYELWTLVEQTSKLDEGCLIEIGVWRGGTGALIAQQAKNCSINDTVYLCDTFKGVVKAGAEDKDYVGGEHSDTSRELVQNLISQNLKLENGKILEGIFPDETADVVESKMFRFCHIDVDVYQSAEDIVDWIWPKMVRGGIIVYDDYGFYTCDGIAKHVEAHISKKGRFVFQNLNGHAVIVKL